MPEKKLKLYTTQHNSMAALRKHEPDIETVVFLLDHGSLPALLIEDPPLDLSSKRLWCRLASIQILSVPFRDPIIRYWLSTKTTLCEIRFIAHVNTHSDAYRPRSEVS